MTLLLNKMGEPEKLWYRCPHILAFLYAFSYWRECKHQLAHLFQANLQRACISVRLEFVMSFVACLDNPFVSVPCWKSAMSQVLELWFLSNCKSGQTICQKLLPFGEENWVSYTRFEQPRIRWQRLPTTHCDPVFLYFL